MDSVFGDWHEDRGEVVLRRVDGSAVESKDHERVSTRWEHRERAAAGGGFVEVIRKGSRESALF